MQPFHLLTGACALDALDQPQRLAFPDHLAGCSECLAEVVGLREAAALLSQVTALAPPPELRHRVLAGITQVRPLPPIVARAVVPTAVPAGPGRRRWIGLTLPRPSS
jgi:hypothetical protein